MPSGTLWRQVKELVRFYQAAVINTAFGVGAYMALVALGLNMYAAQALAHVMGIAFNYFTYSRYVFKGSAPARRRFVFFYILNYFLGLAALAGFSQLIRSPYIAGLAAVLAVSVVSYFMLKHAVFAERAA